MGASDLLTVEELGRSVDGRTLWSGLSFRLGPGDRGVLTGRSGTGKTLLLRTLAALERPDAGRVRFGGAPMEGAGLPALRARMSYVPQKAFVIAGRVRENLMFPFDFRAHAGREWSEAAALRLLEALGRDASFLDRPSETLSGGEGQIVALVRALLIEADVLLLDEPTASLDPETTASVEALLFEWVDGGDRALLWTSHDRAQADRVARGPRIEMGAS